MISGEHTSLTSPKMRAIYLTLLFVAYLGVNVSGQEASRCNSTACSLPDCRCPASDVPGGLLVADVPQVILLSFDGAMTSLIYDNLRPLITGQNPNGCPITATFFVSHEYTNYSLVNDLYDAGFEIGVNSITRRTDQQFWLNASPEEWNNEMVGMREMLGVYGNISTSSVVGSRAPFLILGGNEYFGVLHNESFQWDCSWPTRSFMNPGLWPYTLDYLSTQDCPVGRCPTNSFPGFWVAPMIDMEDTQGSPCATLNQCDVGTTNQSVYEFLKKNFELHYSINRSPYSLSLSAAWIQDPVNVEGFRMFMDDMADYTDVYFLSVSKMLEWVKRPVKTSDLANFEPWKCPAVEARDCVPVYCSYTPALTPDGNTERVMSICNRQCPPYYPWYGNVDGATPYRTTPASRQMTSPRPQL